ncbi:MAG: bis(5'-nucleosyl)-tetraphosphatase (symmetrical) YqeK [Elusimicrobia bacterium]|nr:bis(5'-nucleosyl)-tetraphosphatase (symmetrical) YqeK [Elusimicrobiota bacterium]
MKGNKVLVYGGSFDPPHRGHEALLRAAVKKIRPDKIIIVPNHQSPLKGSPHAPSKDRLIMVRIGILDTLPLKIKVISIVNTREARARRPVFTHETLSALKGDLHFVCGQDSAESFGRWKNPSRLESQATWWYGARPGAKGKVPGHFKKIPGAFPDISSTEIRSDLALDHDCSRELSPKILAYIKTRNLYGNGLVTRLKSSLKPSRYEHTLNVASLAESLARRWGANPDKARLAGLLHDAGRRFTPPQLARFARVRRLKVPNLSEIIALDPMLIHAYASEYLARTEFGIADKEVLSAIRRHTLGDKRMNLLDKILYVADATSIDRTHPNASKIRALAYNDLDAALRSSVAEKLIYTTSRHAWLHPLTVHLWNSLAPL